MKTTKKALRESIDRFFWHLDWVTGGTMEETLRQADHAIADLEAHAATATALAANPSKLCAADAHLMGMAAIIPARLENYRTRYVGRYEAWKAERDAKHAASAEKIILFPLSA